MAKAVITILGIQGGYVDKNKATLNNSEHIAEYYFENSNENTKKEYFNTLPLLIDKYSEEYEIIPIYTADSKIFNNAVFDELYSTLKSKFSYKEQYGIEDEKDFKEVFKLFNNTLEEFDEIIIDVTHGFRHLPLLMLIDLMIINFRDTSKIEKILFAKEEIKHTPKEKGLYEIIDLKEYLELANISFILTTFNKNYTVANHIASKKYNDLIIALNDFSNDIMAINLNNLFKQSSRKLIKELNKLDDISIKSMAEKLRDDIEQNFTLKDGQKRYEIYLKLAIDLCSKNYMLLSLSLLYESSRMYIKTTIKKEHKEIVEDIEKYFEEDWYKVGDFFKNLSWKDYCKLKYKEKKLITYDNYNKLQKSYPKDFKEKIKFKGIPNLTQEATIIEHISNTRNNLSHANSKGNFADIKKSVKKLMFKYKNIIEKKITNTPLKKTTIPKLKPIRIIKKASK